MKRIMKKNLATTNSVILKIENSKEIISKLENEILNLKEIIEKERKKHKDSENDFSITATITGCQLMGLLAGSIALLATYLGYIGVNLITKSDI